MKILKLGQMIGGSNAPSGAGFPNLYSLDFDGTNDYVDFGDENDFSINESGANRGFSISVWVKTSGNSDTIISKSQVAATTAEYQLEVGRDNKLTFWVYSSGNAANYQYLRVDSPIVGDGNWHHVVGTFNLADATTSLSVYIDGVKYVAADAATSYGASGTWVAANNTTAPLEMGRLGNGSNYFGGNIDEFSMFDAELNAAAVTSYYNSGTPTDLSGEAYLVGYWRNGDTAGTSVYPTIEDYSSNSNDGTMTSMASGDIVTVVP